MTKQIILTATHPRSGWTRMAGSILPVHDGPSTDEVMSEFDAQRCIEAGQGEWARDEVSSQSKSQHCE